MKQSLKIIVNLLFLFMLIFPLRIVKKKKKILMNMQINFYSGMFDYSDDGQRAALFGFQSTKMKI